MQAPLAIDLRDNYSELRQTRPALLAYCESPPAGTTRERTPLLGEQRCGDGWPAPSADRPESQQFRVATGTS
jgi:hypothetical protein